MKQSFTLLLSMLALFVSVQSFAQNTNDYRSAGSGNWANAATWEKYNGTSWGAAATAPANTEGEVTILTGHTVSVAADASVDSVVVAAGGTLNINSGVKVTAILNNGGTALSSIKVSGAMNVNGYLLNQGSVSIANAGVITFASGSTYEHGRDAGSIPISTWQTGSLCLITGTAATSPANAKQDFYNFTWNCPLQSANLNLGWHANTISGTLRLVAAGASSTLRLSSSSANGANPVIMTVNNISVEANILTTTGSSGAQVYTLNVTGDVNVIGSGLFNIAGGSGADVTVNLFGNLTLNSSTVQCLTKTAALNKIVFSKAGTQVYTKNPTNTIGSGVNFVIANGATVDMNTSAISSSTPSTFTINAGGGIISAAPGGINDHFASSTQVLNFSPAANFTFNGSTVQSMGTKMDSIVNNLTILNSGAAGNDTVKLATTVRVNGVLTLTDGLLAPSSTNTLIVTATGSIAGGSANSYVVKRLYRETNSTGFYSFPVGKSDAYRPIGITPSTTGTSIYYAEYYKTAYAITNAFTAPVTGVSTTEYWDIEKFSGVAAKVTLYLNGLVPGGTAANQVGVGHFASAAWKWEGGGGFPGNTTTGTMTSNDIASFSPFSFVIVPPGTVPLKLISFNGFYNGRNTQLNWSTSNELNFSHFEIERSADGRNFAAISSVTAKGSTSLNTYTFTDLPLNSGAVYYRLKLVDNDGQYRYSSIVSLNTRLKAGVFVYPNPASASITVSHGLLSDAAVINVYTMSGSLIKATNIAKGAVQSAVDISGLLAGNYQIVVMDANEKRSFQFIKK